MVLLVWVLGWGLAGHVAAAPITFELTPDGSTPTDNMRLDVNAMYQDGTTLVSFGIDANEDLTVDHSAVLEYRNNNDWDANKQVGYILNSGGPQPDTDLTPNNEGGDWLIRSQRGGGDEDDLRLKDGNDFMIIYSGVLPVSAAGQVWDLDFDELFSITAFSSGNVQIAQTFTGPYSGNGRDGLPTSFIFENLSTPIAKIRISYISASSGGGFAFDNFNATQPFITPEPGTGALLLLGLVGLGIRRRNRVQRPH